MSEKKKERNPKEPSLSLQDLHDLDCQSVLEGVTELSYRARWKALAEAATQAEQNGQLTVCQAFNLLANACSMALQPTSWNEPFAASVRMSSGRSIELMDFSDEEIDLLANAADEFDDPWIKSRLAEMAWIRKTPRDINYVLTALSGYQQIPINLDSFLRDGAQTWTRAVFLAKRFGKSTKQILRDLETFLTDALLQSGDKDGFLALWVADLLKGFDLGSLAQKSIASQLESLATSFANIGDRHKQREYLLKAAKWYQDTNKEEKAAELTALAAESYVGQAYPPSEKPKAVAAMYWIEKAIHLYRSIPKKYRDLNRVDELRKMLADCGKEAIEEMVEIRTESIDVTQTVQAARASVVGKTPLEGLLTLANIAPLTDIKTLREAAVQNLGRFHFRSFAMATTMSKDGRVVQKQPSLDPSQSISEQERLLLAEMLTDFRIHIDVTCHARILPALGSLQLEHRITEGDFIELAKQSPLVPLDRCRLFGKALYLGYDWDFGTAIQLLCPQVENMLRSHMKSASATTTNLDQQGIETETSLNTLINLPLATKILGEGLAFEIKNLFCEPGGPNLRNQVAHGLLNDDEICSYPCVYAWWLTLRLVINSAWNAGIEPSEHAPKPDRNSTD